MCDTRNQTHKDVLDYIVENNLDTNKDLGIGMYMIPAPENGILEYKVINVDNLSYREAVKRGENCTAFQWLPFGLDFKHKDGTIKLSRLQDLEEILWECNDSCRGGCPYGCFCWTGESMCHKNSSKPK